MIEIEKLALFESFLDRDDIIAELENRNLKFEFSDQFYGSGLKVIFIDRHAFDHEFFNERGYGLIVQPQKFIEG